jgi:hypothetical protein
VLVGLTGLHVGAGSPSSRCRTCFCCGVWRWVEHRAWFMDCLAHCWVLRGHPAKGVCLLAPGPDCLTRPLLWVWWWSWWVGVWLCVECCIVDASILL